jgi:hypothetical protein
MTLPTSRRTSLRVIAARKGGSPHWIVEHDPQRPPDIFFDTNVWISMNDGDISALERLERQLGFRYRYSITNYCELLSHFEDPPSKSSQNPFIKYRQCFRKIIRLCHADVLPSPEMEFLSMTKLKHYLEPAWIPDPDQTALGIKVAANARNLAELTGEYKEEDETRDLPRYVIKPRHYRTLRDTDDDSFRKIMEILREITPPIRGSHKEKLDKLGSWFFRLANFFFLVRASNGKINLNSLTPQEQERFAMVFTAGAGKLFHFHCISVAKKTINDKRKINPNDLYDAMQLLLLNDGNRLFVTDDRFFYYYEIDPEIQRVLLWSAFRTSG